MSATAETEPSREEQAAAKLLGVEGFEMWERAAWAFSGKTYHIRRWGEGVIGEGARRVPFREVVTIVPIVPLPLPSNLFTYTPDIRPRPMCGGKAYKAPAYVWIKHFTFTRDLYVGYLRD